MIKKWTKKFSSFFFVLISCEAISQNCQSSEEKPKATMNLNGLNIHLSQIDSHVPIILQVVKISIQAKILSHTIQV